MSGIKIEAIVGRIRSNIKIVVATGFGIVAGGVGSVIMAHAAIPDASGVIHACRLNATGTVRIIDSASESCNGLETSVNWNQTAGAKSVLVTDLTGADLREANMVGWDLRNLDFTDANLFGAKLNGADITNAVFTDANLSFAFLEGMDFSDYDLQRATFGGNSFGTADFEGADFTDAVFGYSSSSSSNGGNFHNAKLANATISDGFNDSNFTGADFTDATFSPRPADGFNEIYFTNVNFTGADFTNVDFTTNTSYTLHFSSSDFDGVNLSNVDISRVIWHGTTCPDGVNSNDNGNTCAGHLVP